MSAHYLTKRQVQALNTLNALGSLYPATQFRGGDRHPFSRKTLQALVDTGHARWVTTHGLMPHIVKAGGTDPGTPSSSPGRDYLVGMPVLVTVRDDGTVHLEICAEDIVEAVADCDTTEDVSDDQRVADSATAGAAFTARTLTLSTN